MSTRVGVTARSSRSERSQTVARRPWWPLDLGLGIGLIGTTALAILAVYGPILAPHDFWYTRSLLAGGRPPFPPGPEFPLGSDAIGHDLLSWLLIGARTTLLIAAGATLLRMVIGGFLGAFAGWQGGRADAILSSAALAFSAIPGTILAILGVLMFNVRAGPLAFMLALGLLGWGDAFHSARRHARAEADRHFIESARSLGMSESRVVLRHLVPNMAPSLLTLTALQASAVLLLFAELGLVRLFVGGATVLDIDQRSGVPTAVSPMSPDWSSMLAATRPIVDVYGSAHTILVPGIALLMAVVVTGLLGDALARRALRLDVYSLFSRRQTMVLVAVLASIVAPVALWPSPLAPDIAAADRLRGDLALATARELAGTEFRGRVAGSEGSLEAASLISRNWDGRLQTVTGEVPVITSGTMRTERAAVDTGGDLTPLSLRAVNVRGPLRDAPSTSSRSIRQGAHAGQVLVARDPSGSLGFALGVAEIGAAAALVIVSDDLGRFVPGAAYRVPTMRIGTAAFAELTGIDPLRVHSRDLPLPPLEAAISIVVEQRSFTAANVIARAPGTSTDGPLILIVVPYDQPRRTHYLAIDPAWGGAAAVGVVAELLSELRERPLPAEIVAIAVGGDSLGGAGTRAAVSALGPEAGRVVAAVSVGFLGTGRPSLEVSRADLAARAASVSSQVGGRVADALGARLVPTDLPLAAVLRSANVSGPVFGLTDFEASPAAPDRDAIRDSARDLYVLLSYVARHPEELRR